MAIMTSSLSSALQARGKRFSVRRVSLGQVVDVCLELFAHVRTVAGLAGDRRLVIALCMFSFLGFKGLVVALFLLCSALF